MTKLILADDCKFDLGMVYVCLLNIHLATFL